MRHPHAVALGCQPGFQQLDRLDDNHCGAGALHQDIDRLVHERVNHGFQFGEQFCVGEDQLGQRLAVDFALFIQDPLAEGAHHLCVARRALGDRAVAEGIRIDTVRTQVLEHLAHDALAGGDVACQPDDEFARPAAHAGSGNHVWGNRCGSIVVGGGAPVKANADLEARHGHAVRSVDLVADGQIEGLVDAQGRARGFALRGLVTRSARGS